MNSEISRCGVERALALLPWLLLAGCATARVPVALRTESEARPVAGETKVFLLPETAVPNGSRGWAQFLGDSLVVYRPQHSAGAEPAFRRSVHRVGSGIQVGGYTLTDGRHVGFKGTVRRSGDQLIFRRPSPWRSMERVEKSGEVSVAIGEVRALEVWLPDAGQTVIAWGAVALMATVAVGLTIASSLQQSLY